MRPGRELDTSISQEVFGRTVFVKKRILHETTENGDRPLRNYSKDIAAAWEVAEKMGVGLIPVENNQWFAIVGGAGGWTSPADFMSFLSSGNFVNSGAAVADEAPLAICLAAMHAINSKKAAASSMATPRQSSEKLQ